MSIAAELSSTTSSSRVSTLCVNEANDSADIQILISQPIAKPETVALTNCAWVPKNTAGSYEEKIGNGLK
ncbi:MAG: hypothetical protein M3Y53_04545 [Thermoproteota archaeon]|nr:hypothetical protein [Thermoproteota archaeon]